MKDLKTVIVGYDGSPDSKRAVRAAAELVASDGVIHIVNAVKLPSVSEVDRLLNELPAEFRDSFDATAGAEGALKEAGAILKELGVTHQSHLVDGGAAEAILDTADELGSDLIVVGSRGLGRAARFVRGSVSSRVANHARASVLIMHTDDD